MLLGDAELRELGFLMGPRKELLRWSSQQSQGVSSSSSSMSTSSNSLNGATSVQPSDNQSSQPTSGKFKVNK